MIFQWTKRQGNRAQYITSQKNHRDVSTAILLYVFASFLLFSSVGNHPAFPYNWEPYTAWRVFSFWIDQFQPSDVFAVTDGLMTDSGQGPLIGFPAWLAFRVFGISLSALRIPVTLLSAGAVPLLWVVGRRLIGHRAALLAALLLALSPMWLLYGRTATLVGVSVVPALLTTYLLQRTLEDKHVRLQYLVLLQVALIVGAYAYAPIRFLWPISLGLMAVHAARAGHRRNAIVSLTVTACVLPLALVAIGAVTGTHKSAVESVIGYYNARGEQLLALNKSPENYTYYLEEDVPDQGQASRRELAARLMRQNVGDLARLMFDWDTAPALTHYYNPRGEPVGRLYPRALAPFLLIGVIVCLRRLSADKRQSALILLAMAVGFTLPMLLTSRVHIGRLIFALPFLLLLVGIGAIEAGNVLEHQCRRLSVSGTCRHVLLRGAPVVFPLILSVVMVSSARDEGHTIVPEPRAERVEAVLRTAAEQSPWPGGALISGESAASEAVAVATYRLRLNYQYTFVNVNDVAAPDTHQSTEHPRLYYGGLRNLPSLEKLPDPCQLIYFIDPAIQDRFAPLMEHIGSVCPRPPRHVILPQ